VTALVNNAAGGTQGTAVTAANSGGGSGNAWDGVVGTPTITYDNTRGYAPFSYKAVISGIVTSQQMQWSTSLGTVTSLYGHIYVYSAAIPTGARTGLVRMSSAGTQVARISMETDGTITFRNSGNGATLTFTNHMPTNQWFRIEYKVLPAVSNGTLEMKLYLNAASSTPDETLTSTVAALGAANIDTVAFGNFTTSAGPAWTAWLAHMNVDTAGYPAPITFQTTTDSGSGADAVTLTAAMSTGDTASGTETFAPSRTVADTATGTDAISSRAITAADTAASADAISTFGMSSTDSASGVDASTLTTALSDGDTASATETASIGLIAADSGNAIDAASLTAALTDADSASAADSTSLEAGAWRQLDSGFAGFADGNSGHVFTYPGGAPDEDDLLVLSVSSDTVVSAPSGYLVAVADVDNIGAYLFYKVAGASEPGSVTITTSGNFNTAAGFLRYTGGTGTPLDVTAAAHSTSNAATTPTATTGALATAGELVIAAACLGGLGGGTPHGVTWSTGYTGRIDGQTTGTSGTDQHLFVADNYAGGSTESPNASWTSGVNNQTLLVAAFRPLVAAESVSDADAGSGADSAQLAVSLTASDSATAVDSATLTVTLSTGDAALGVEAIPATQRTAADTSTVTDTVVVSAAFTASDTGSALDDAQLAALLNAADTASTVEGATVDQSNHETSSDSGSVADAATLIAQQAATDIASAADTASVIASLAVADSAHGVDSAVLHVALSVADVAHAADVAALTSGAGNYSGTARTSSYGGGVAVAERPTGTATTDSYGGEVSWPH